MTYSSDERTRVLVVSHTECIAAMIVIALISLFALFELDAKLSGGARLSPAAKLSNPEITKNKSNGIV